MKKFFRKKISEISLGQKFLLILGVFLVIGAAINSVQFFRVLNMVEDGEVKSLQTSAQTVGIALSSQFYERYGDVQAFARNQVFQKGSKAEMIEALNQYSMLYGIYDLISFVDSKGSLIAANNLDGKGKEISVDSLYVHNFSNDEWFAKVRDGAYLEDKEKNFSGTVFIDFSYDPMVSAVLKSDVYSTLFVAPVLSPNGKVLGYLCNHANSKWIENELELAYKQLASSGNPSASVSLLNGNGESLVLVNDKNELKPISILTKDSNQILKENWKKFKFQPALLATKGLSGSGLFKNSRSGKEVYVGYSPIQSTKFIESIGWSVIIQVPTNYYLTEVRGASFEFLGCLLAVLVVSFIFTLWFAKNNHTHLKKMTLELEEIADGTALLGKEVAAASQTVETSISSNQSAIQESVSALSEMSSMMAQTNVNAKVSLDKTEKAKQCAMEGRETMERMSHSMNAIQQSNAELQAIAALIENINQKTNIINDIAFKTQILSFNASIESARAGQHGRGFGVVAQEVGKLADVSAASAAEIKSLIEESVQKVNSTLEGIQTRLSEGNKVSKEAIEVFEEIASQVEDISLQVKSIKEASDQQEKGIFQANQAMRDIDQASQRSSEAAMSSRTTSQNLMKQSIHMQEVVTNLTKVIVGSN